MIGIIDYGAGNLASVRNALDQIGREAVVVNHPEAMDGCERLILPGVGSFRLAMEALDHTGWAEALREYVSRGRPLLGICLGMQLLFDEGEEHGITPGLGLVPGRVVLMTPRAPHRLPHVGWNNLVHVGDHALFEGIKRDVDLYFVHSYRCIATDAADVIAWCDHGGEFAASIARGSVVGMQFHPEKSWPAGIRILENFADWDGSC